MSCLRNFSVLCGVSLILLATTAQPAAAQGDPCAPYANNAPYYQRCQLIQQQSQRIREEQQRHTQQQEDIREKRLQGFRGTAQQTPTVAKTAPAQTPAQGAQTIPVTPTTTTPTATASVTAATPQPAVQGGSVPPVQGAGYIVIDPAKLSTEQLQSIMTILKQSSPQATVYTAAPTVVASPVVQSVPTVTASDDIPFSKRYPTIAGKDGTTAVALPDVGQGGQEIMEIEPVDPASLRLQQ